MTIKIIPIELLDYFEYSEKSKSGLVFKKHVYNKNGKLHTRKGTEAGTIIRGNGRVKQWQVHISAFGKFAVHRIIWLLENGFQDSDNVIDHIDGNPLNNNLSNLRLVTMTTNNRNSARDRISLDNTLPNGVSCKLVANGTRTAYNPYFIVSWPENEKSRFKYFSINNLGIMRAHLAAVKFRLSKEIDFTERHGK